MTLERIEQLAAWADAEANALDYEGSEKASRRLRDLARCTRAWATMERFNTDPGWMLSRDEFGTNLESGFGDKLGGHSTAIEAVEAAGGGK